MEWEIGFALLVGLCLLVCTAPVLHTIIDLDVYDAHQFVFHNADVVMISPIGEIRTAGEKLVCGSPVTHVGLVWIDVTNTPFIFHTTRATGAHLEPLIPYIRRLNSRHQVFVRCVTGMRVPPTGGQLERAIVPLLGMRYSFGFWKAVMQTWWPGVEMPRTVYASDRFCSELVAEVLEKVGVVNFTSTELSPRLVLPSDFWTTSRLPFIHGVNLLPPQELIVNEF